VIGTPAASCSWSQAYGVGAVLAGDVVVVVKEQRVRVRLVRPPECLGNDLRPEGGDPEVVRVDSRGVAVEEEFVGDVPLPYLSPVPRDLDHDVLIKELLELRGGNGAVGDAGGEPVRKLVVPQQRVAADELPVRLREGDQLVGLGPVVAARGRLDDLPFHPVARGDHGKLAAGDGRVRGSLDVLGDQRGAEAEADPRGQRAQRVGLVVLARAWPAGRPGGGRRRPGGGAGAYYRRGTAGGAHREKTTASHEFPPVASRNISRHSENFGLDLSVMAP
jgi:hypothetical protein